MWSNDLIRQSTRAAKSEHFEIVSQMSVAMIEQLLFISEPQILIMLYEIIILDCL